MKKILKFTALFCTILAIGLASCKKVEVVDALGNGGQRLVAFKDVGGKDSLTSTYGNSNLFLDPSLASETFEFRLVLFTPVLPSSDFTVSIDVDPAKVTEYMAYRSKIPFVSMPTSLYSLPNKTVTFKANQTISEPFTLTINNALLNPALSYMVPISIKALNGAPADFKIAPGTGTAYFHIIGNPLAGTYNMTALRYNYNGSVTFNGNPASIPTPASTTAIPATKLVSPIDADNVWADFSNLGSATSFDFEYIITQVGGFSSINVDYNANFKNGNTLKGTYLSGYVAPSPTQKARFRIITHYNNDPAGIGNDRIIDELFVQQ